MRHYRGLALITTTGIIWRWAGWKVAHLRGRDMRVEKWQAPCPQCGETITLCAKLGSGLRQKFYERRYNAAPSEVLEVQLPLPGKPAPGRFEVLDCNDHRRAFAASAATETVTAP
jgi:hypothetical protein